MNANLFFNIPLGSETTPATLNFNLTMYEKVNEKSPLLRGMDTDLSGDGVFKICNNITLKFSKHVGLIVHSHPNLYAGQFRKSILQINKIIFDFLQFIYLCPLLVRAK